MDTIITCVKSRPGRDESTSNTNNASAVGASLQKFAVCQDKAQGNHRCGTVLRRAESHPHASCCLWRARILISFPGSYNNGRSFFFCVLAMHTVCTCAMHVAYTKLFILYSVVRRDPSGARLGFCNLDGWFGGTNWSSLKTSMAVWLRS